MSLFVFWPNNKRRWWGWLGGCLPMDIFISSPEIIQYSYWLTLGVPLVLIRTQGARSGTLSRHSFWISWCMRMYSEYMRKLFLDKLIEVVIHKTSLLRRLQEQTLPDEAPPMGKIHPFSKITVTFEPVMQFWCPSRFRISLKNCSLVYFMTESTISNHWGVVAP